MYVSCCWDEKDSIKGEEMMIEVYVLYLCYYNDDMICVMYFRNGEWGNWE